MTKHTPEPWSAQIIAKPKRGVVLRSETRTICMEPISAPFNENAEADFRRIVACVNACAGIPTEYLEATFQRFPNDRGAALRYLADFARETAKAK